MTWRNVLGMFILVALCGVAFWWIQRDDGTGAQRLPTALLDVFDKRDVSAVRMTGYPAEGDPLDVTVRRRPDSSESWDVQIGTEWARADAIAIDEILSAIARADVSAAFPSPDVTPEQRAAYGLDKPTASVTLTLPGEERTARFGVRTREGSGVYADRGAGTDVLIVAVTPHDELRRAIQQGVRDRRITELRTYDVRKIEVAQRGVTTLEAEKDLAQIWRLRQPVSGYADMTLFETRISHIVNEQWKRIEEDGAVDLPRYGLITPAASVTMTSKRDVVSTVHLGGEAGPDGDRYAKEDGYGTIFVVSKRFADALLAPVDDIRDRSFTRLGLGIEKVTVSFGATSYVLSKAHTEWEIESPVREPAEEARVKAFLDSLRQWHVVEFLDGEDPTAYGVTADGPQIQVETQGGTSSTYLLGNETSEGRRYAQRKDDGQLVIVLGGPAQEAAKGWLQFRLRAAWERTPEDIRWFARQAGSGPDAVGIVSENWERDLGSADEAWKMRNGQTGAGLDAKAMNELLRTLKTINAVEWLHWNATKNAEMGFDEGGGGAATAWIEVDYRAEAGRNPDILLIGKKLPDRDVYFARVKGADFAFLMAADVVARLTAPLMAR